jgi:hypothetical protein
MWHLQIKAWVIAAVLWLQDMYIDAIAMINRLWLSTLVMIIKFSMYVSVNQNKYSNNTRLLYASSYNDAQDLTLAVRCFYACDKIQSCGSLYRWLAKFGPVDPQLNLVFVRGEALYTSRINLDTEEEELNEVEIPFGGIRLNTLPAKNMYLLSKSRTALCCWLEKKFGVTDLNFENGEKIKHKTDVPSPADTPDESYLQNAHEHDD